MKRSSTAKRCGTSIPRLSVSPECRFSNRPFGVKRFQTIRRYSVDVAHGLVLLFGIGTRPLYGVFFVKEFVGPRRASFSFVGFLI